MTYISVHSSEWGDNNKVIRYNNFELKIPFNENVFLANELINEIHESLFYSTYTEKELKDLKQTIENWINNLNHTYKIVVEHITEGDFKQDV